MDTQKYLRNVVTLEYDPSLCIGCRLCIEVCPHNVFRMSGKKAEVAHRDKCIECGACDLNCVTGALRGKARCGMRLSRHFRVYQREGSLPAIAEEAKQM
jgi:ferredoxin